MKVLVINCGSSSLKYTIFDMEEEKPLVEGLVERIGIDNGILTQEVEGREDYVINQDIPDHEVAGELVLGAITDEEHGVISSLDEIEAVGHRVVHGGEALTESAIVDDSVKEAIKEYAKFAPLHNPANLMGIEAVEAVIPDKPNVVVFDTAFHQTMPASSYMYAIPYKYYEDYKIRKYGFHGTSHDYVTTRTAEILGKDASELNIITCHLGNGASISAVKNGKCYDTSMGLTPLEGLIMGTRSGDLDPAVITWLMEEENLTPQDVDNLLNRESGVYGVSGVSSDFRDLEERADEGCERCRLALDMFYNRVKRYIGAYLVSLGDVDAITFTAGIGENSALTRGILLEGLESLGIEIDEEKNNVRGEDVVISTDDSRIKVLTVQTDEELMIARDTQRLVNE